MRFEELTPQDAVAAYPPAPQLPPLEAADLVRQRVDGHGLVRVGDEVVARASVWWREVPALPGERLGVIGHFAARDGAAAALLLARLGARLAGLGCTRAVGPMDGNTWRRYRFVTDPGSEPPFFLEPTNPPEYPRYFAAAGFAPLATYSSALVTGLDTVDGRLPRASARLQANGVAWRPLDPQRSDDELRAIYALSVRSFTRNFLYTPIAEAEFLAQYRAVAPHVEPALTLMAERAGELQGYLFGIPDLAQAQRGEPVDTCIVKTVAVLPGRDNAGLGSVLVGEVQRIAREHGYRRAIHALMHDANTSRNISTHYARSMRRYTLYQRPLVAP